MQTLILRGVFLCRRADVDYFFQGNAAKFATDPLAMSAPGAYLDFPTAWRHFAVLGGLADISALGTTQYPEIQIGDKHHVRSLFDHFLVQARLASGAALSVEVAGGRPPDATPFRFEVTGETGTLVLEGGAPRGFHAGSRDRV